MTRTVPWSLRGVGPGARETAREAARRDGTSLGEWLDHIITRHTARLDQADDDAEGSGFRDRGAARPPRPAPGSRPPLASRQADGLEAADGGDVLRPRFVRPRMDGRSNEETRVLPLRRPSDSTARENDALLLLAEAAAEMERRAAQTGANASPANRRLTQLEARLGDLAALVEATPGTARPRDDMRNFRTRPVPPETKWGPDFAPNLGATPRPCDSYRRQKTGEAESPGRIQHAPFEGVRQMARDFARNTPPAYAGGLNTMLTDLDQKIGLAEEAIVEAVQTAHQIALAGDRLNGNRFHEIVAMQRHQAESSGRTEAALTAIYEILAAMAGGRLTVEHDPAGERMSRHAPVGPFRPVRRR